MKILQTPIRFYPAVGGVEKYVFHLASHMVKRQHQITIICADDPSSSIKSVEGIKIKRLRYIGKIANTNITPYFLFRVMREDFDLIHAHMPTPWNAELSLLAAKLKGKPCILTYHNDVKKQGFLGVVTKLYNMTILKCLLLGVDRILVTQSSYLEKSHTLAPYSYKVAVVPNGIDRMPSTSLESRDSATVLFVSVLDRYHRYKGLDYLIRAVASLKSRYPEIKLEVVGEGELVGEYQALAEELRVQANVHFHGYVDDVTLDTFYQRSTAFVLPSIDTHEGFGIVLLEAMAHEVPVVTTRVIGTSDEIADHCAGIIVPEKDVDAIAQAIDQILRNPLGAIEMGRNGSALVREKYLWSEICQSLEQIYCEAVG